MLSFIGVIPSRETVSRSEKLNLLGGVANDGEALSTELTVWGRAGSEWRSLVSTRCALAAGEHRHLYFSLPPEVFSPAFWGEEVEELELIVRDAPPDPDSVGKLIFIES